MAGDSKRTFDLTEPRVEEARELSELWRKAFSGGGWPSKDRLGNINDYLENVVFPKTAWKREPPLIDVIDWVDSRWGLYLKNDLNEFCKRFLPSSRPLISELVRLDRSEKGVSPRRGFRSLFGWVPSANETKWYEVIGYDPNPQTASDASPTELKALLHLCNARAVDVLKPVGDVSAEGLWKELIWSRLQRDRKTMDQRVILFVEWLDLIEHWELIKAIENMLFWPGALPGETEKLRQKEREKKRRQRARDRGLS